MSEIEREIQQLWKSLNKAPLTKEWLDCTIFSLGIYAKLNGTIGPYYIRNVKDIRNDKIRMIISKRTQNFHMSYTPASILNRKKMSAANKFAMFLKSIEVVYKTWTQVQIEGNNGFTRLIKSNKKKMMSFSPSPKNIITPDKYELYIEDLVKAEGRGKFTIKENYVQNAKDKLVIILAAVDPLKKGISDYECFEINSGPAKAGQVFELKTWQKEICRNYKRFIVYYAVISENGKKIKWSNTCVTEGLFELGSEYFQAEEMGYGQLPMTALVSADLILVKPPG